MGTYFVSTATPSFWSDTTTNASDWIVKLQQGFATRDSVKEQRLLSYIKGHDTTYPSMPDHTIWSRNHPPMYAAQTPSHRPRQFDAYLSPQDLLNVAPDLFLEIGGGFSSFIHTMAADGWSLTVRQKAMCPPGRGRVRIMFRPDARKQNHGITLLVDTRKLISSMDEVWDILRNNEFTTTTNKTFKMVDRKPASAKDQMWGLLQGDNRLAVLDAILDELGGIRPLLERNTERTLAGIDWAMMKVPTPAPTPDLTNVIFLPPPTDQTPLGMRMELVECPDGVWRPAAA